jgi:predicted esterase
MLRMRSGHLVSRLRWVGLVLSVAAGCGGQSGVSASPTPAQAAPTPNVSCVTWAATQRAAGVPPGPGNVTTQRNSLYNSGGGVRALNSRYYAAYFPPGWAQSPRRRVMLNLHGTGGAPEDQWAIDWASILPNRNWAFLGLKYLDDATGIYDSEAVIYQNLKAMVDDVRANCDFGAVTSFLVGFSRGSAQAFSAMANDVKDRRLFTAAGHNSGAWIIGGPLPPTLQAIASGGDRNALATARHWMYCGERDNEHGYPMCDEMENARAFVVTYGGVVSDVFRDPTGGHGGLAKNQAALSAMFAYFESLP